MKNNPCKGTATDISGHPGVTPRMRQGKHAVRTARHRPPRALASRPRLVELGGQKSEKQPHKGTAPDISGHPVVTPRMRQGKRGPLRLGHGPPCTSASRRTGVEAGGSKNCKTTPCKARQRTSWASRLPRSATGGCRAGHSADHGRDDAFRAISQGAEAKKCKTTPGKG